MTILVDMDDTMGLLLEAWVDGANRAYDADANGMIRVNNWTEIENVIAEMSASD